MPSKRPVESLTELLACVRACAECRDLPLGPRPVIQAHRKARIAVIGGYWQSDRFRLFAFGLAAGAILYIIGELLHIGRRLKGEAVVEAGLLAGFALAFVAEMLLAYSGMG